VEFGVLAAARGWARRAGPTDVDRYVVGVKSEMLKALSEGPDFFRSRRLIRSVAEIATGITATLGGEVRFELQRLGPDKEWRLTKPFQFPADQKGRDSAVMDFLGKLDRLRIASFVPRPADLGAPLGSLTVKWQDKGLPMDATFNAYRVDGKLVVEDAGEKGDLYEVGDEFLDLVQRDPMQLRWKRLCEEGKLLTADQTKATLRMGTDELIVERRQAGTWRSVKGTTKLGAMQTLLNGLPLREAKRFVPASEKPDLGQPTLELDVEWGPQTFTLRAFGEAKDGYYATCSALPEDVVFIMDRTFYNDAKAALGME
jgi:hypothetical protein